MFFQRTFLSFLAAFLMLISTGLATERFVPSQYSTIQSAIDAAVDSDMIIISPGTYTGEGNRDIDFKGKAITVRSTDPNDPGIVAATIIDCQGKEEDPHRGFYFHSGEEPRSVLAGLRITNGYGLDEDVRKVGSAGGGIFCEHSNPTIASCMIDNNYAKWKGGGMCNSKSRPIIKDCTFAWNSVFGEGGGLFNYQSDLEVLDCKFIENSAMHGGGMHNWASSPTVTRCTFTENWTSYSAAGMFNRDGGSPTVRNCKFLRNSAGTRGGGMYNFDGSNSVVVNCLFTGNSAGDKGGGMYNNSSHSGPVISPTVLNCTFSGNSALKGGGGVCNNRESKPILTNSIFWANSDNEGMGEPAQIFNLGDDAAPVVNYCCIQGWTGTLHGEGNIDADPLFVNMEADDCHLLPDSPCVDSGDPTCRPPRDATDIDGEPRVMGVRVDMGIDELMGSLIPSINIWPATFSFKAKQSGSDPPAKGMFIANNDYGTLKWNVTADCSWLNAQPTNGSCVLETDQIFIDVNTAGLAWGEHTCTITVSDPCALNNPQKVDISIVVVGPVIELSENRITFRAYSGMNPASQTLTVQNDGGGTLNWQITNDCNWLKVEPRTGSISAGQEDRITLSANVASLSVDKYECELTIWDPNSENVAQNILVTLWIRVMSTGRILSVPSEYATIQVAVDAAIQGDTIVIAPGIYIGDGNYDIDFKGKAITVRSIDPNDPNIVAATIIDCERQGRAFYLDGCVGAIISGLTITNGYAEAGGGIYIEDSIVAVQNCRIISNKTVRGKNPSDPNGGPGGAIFCKASSTSIQNCTIEGNKTGSGASADMDYVGGDGGCGAGVYTEDCSLIVSDCNVCDNSTGIGGFGIFDNWGEGSRGNGGGIYSRGQSKIYVTLCEIKNNSAGYGGGLYSEDYSGTIDSCFFVKNEAECGGGIYYESEVPLIVSNCCISHNKACSGTNDGGGIYCSSVIINNSTITANYTIDGSDEWAETSAGDGGSGGGIYCQSAVIEDTTISGNFTGDGGYGWDGGGEAGDGGGVYCMGSLQLFNCTVNDNSTGKGGGSPSWGGGDGGNGGGIWANSVTAKSCKIVENRAGDGGGGSIHGRGGDGGLGGSIYCLEAHLVECEVRNNVAGDGGGSSNIGGNGGKGGGLYCAGRATIADSVFIHNRAGDAACAGSGCGDGGNGGGIHCGAGTIVNCLISGNLTGNGGYWSWGTSEIAGFGGGIYFSDEVSLSEVLSCTIIANITGEYTTYENHKSVRRGKGAGIYCNSQTTVKDSIIWSNEPNGVFSIDCNNISYCDIQDANCIGGVGNISADPCFMRPGQWVHARDQSIIVDRVDPDAIWIGDYRLSHVATGQQANSPCIDAGSDLAENLGLGQFTTRIDGVGDTGIVDMGFHYVGPTSADADRDTDVDWDDFAVLAEHWFGDVNWPAYYAGPAELAKVDLFRIPKGSAVVDSDLDEWAGDWSYLRQVYYGDPIDVPLSWGASYALRWDPATGKLCVAVRVYDEDHLFSDEYIRWDASDRIEIYVQAVPEGGTGFLGIYAIAQQYMIGPNTSGGYWATWALGEPIADDVGFEAAVWVRYDYIYYEIAIPMFDHYGGFSGGETVKSVLEPGRVIGFDVIVSSRDSEGHFGMLSDNLLTGKSQNAGQFFKRVLSAPRLYLPQGGYESDLNYDGVVDWKDLAMLAEQWLWSGW